MTDPQSDLRSADSKLAKAFVTAIGHPAVVLDGDGHVVLWNSDALNSLSKTEDEVGGRALVDLFKPSDNDDIASRLARLKSGRPVARFAVTVPSGSMKMKLDRLDGPTSDLFLCQLTPDEVINAARLPFLMEHLDQGVWNYNVLTDTFSATDGWRRMHHVGPDVDIRGEGACDDWLEKVHPDDRDLLREMTDQQRDGTRIDITGQYRLARPEGGWKWLLCRAKAMAFDADGHPVQIVGIDTDISEVKESEGELSRLAEKMRLAIDVARFGVYEFDPANETVHWDDRLLDIYGVEDKQNLRPAHLWENYLHPDDRDAAIECGDIAFKTKKSIHQDYRIIRSDGEVRHLRNQVRYIEGVGKSGKLLGVNIDITEDVLQRQELEEARQRLEHDSRHDALTGLANRRLLDEETDDLLARLDGDTTFAVLHLDLDHFKEINDTLGHAAGDIVLVHVGKTLKALVGRDGLVCRIGGDEFVILLKSVEKIRDVKTLCQTMICQIARPLTVQGEICEVGVSIGCALASAGVMDASEVFINADIALYAAKSDGRSCFRLHQPGMQPVSQDEASARRALLSALTEGQLTCYLQPQFDAKTHALTGAEALARWNCPDRGILTPDKFLPTAEKAGLLARIDEYIFNHVLALQTQWMRNGLEYPTISLNLSLDRLRESGMVDDVARALAPHHKVSFELLETAFLDTTDTVTLFNLERLRGLGVRIDLDDFGSGHSSVVALQTIKPDTVKIDRQLVASVVHKPSQILTLKAVISLARYEGCDVTVEGIETDEQIAIIAELDCAALQGFGLGHPMPAADFSRRFMIKEDVMSR